MSKHLSCCFVYNETMKHLLTDDENKASTVIKEANRGDKGSCLVGDDHSSWISESRLLSSVETNPVDVHYNRVNQ